MHDMLIYAKDKTMPQLIERNEVEKYIGHQCETTDWFEVTQDQVDVFADCTIDRQFIHVDPVAAASTPFGGTIAHGFLTLSMLSYFSTSYNLVIKGITMGVNKGFDKVRFVSPVRVGSKIRCHAKVIDIKEKRPGQFDFKTEVSIEIEGEDKPALVAEWLAVQMVSKT
jgi:acyl dehydratase